MEDPLVDVTHLSKMYGEKTAVADISFTVQPGEILAFLGPNGAGRPPPSKSFWV